MKGTCMPDKDKQEAEPTPAKQVREVLDRTVNRSDKTFTGPGREKKG